MKKHSINFIIGGLLFGSLFYSVNTNGTGKRYIVKLKGNVLYPGVKHKNVSDKVETEQPVLTRENSSKPITVNPTALSFNNTTTQAEKAPVQAKLDFQKSEASIHNSIYQLFPGTYLDSMQFVNQLLIDSVRNEIAANKDVDSVGFLKLCLTNALRDSMTLVRLGNLSSTDDMVKQIASGELIAHCKDASTAFSMDSVVMDIFSGSRLVVSAITDRTGTCSAKGITPGDYYVIFSRKNYLPFSLMKVKVAGTGQSYVEIPLAKDSGYFFRTFGSNAWLIITVGCSGLLILIIAGAFALAKFNARRATKPLFRAKELSY